MDDNEVRRRCNHGLTRLTEQDRAELPPPGRGGSLGYPVWNHRVEIARAQTGLETTAHRISISRWNNKLALRSVLTTEDAAIAAAIAAAAAAGEETSTMTRTGKLHPHLLLIQMVVLHEPYYKTYSLLLLLEESFPPQEVEEPKPKPKQKQKQKPKQKPKQRQYWKVSLESPSWWRHPVGTTSHRPCWHHHPYLHRCHDGCSCWIPPCCFFFLIWVR